MKNFSVLLKPNGFLVIDTKKFKDKTNTEGKSELRELKFEKSNNTWIPIVIRIDKAEFPVICKVTIQTKIVYDYDPSFIAPVNREIILITIFQKTFLYLYKHYRIIH